MYAPRYGKSRALCLAWFSVAYTEMPLRSRSNSESILMAEHPRLSAPSVHLHLQKTHSDQAPADIRTVRRLMDQYRAKQRAEPTRDEDRPWSLAETSPNDAATVMRVLADVIQRTQGERDFLTKREAQWVARVFAVAPDLEMRWLAWLAIKYAARESHGIHTSSLDQLLALAPWRNDEAFAQYAEFVREAHPEWVAGRESIQLEGSVLDACRMRTETEAERSGREPTADDLARVIDRWFGGVEAPVQKRRRRRGVGQGVRDQSEGEA